MSIEDDKLNSEWDELKKHLMNCVAVMGVDAYEARAKTLGPLLGKLGGSLVESSMVIGSCKIDGDKVEIGLEQLIAILATAATFGIDARPKFREFYPEVFARAKGLDLLDGKKLEHP